MYKKYILGHNSLHHHYIKLKQKFSEITLSSPLSAEQILSVLAYLNFFFFKCWLQPTELIS